MIINCFLAGADDAAFCHRVAQNLSKGWLFFGHVRTEMPAAIEHLRCGHNAGRANISVAARKIWTTTPSNFALLANRRKREPNAQICYIRKAFGRQLEQKRSANLAVFECKCL